MSASSHPVDVPRTERTGRTGPQAWSAKALRLLLLIGGLLVFAGLYGFFYYKIWTTSANASASIDKQLIYVGSALGGVLASFFAVALGIQRRDPAVQQNKLRLGETLVGSGGAPAWLGTVALWLYALVGLAAGVTVIVHSVQSPDAIKAMAAVFGGYALSVFSAAFAPASQS